MLIRSRMGVSADGYVSTDDGGLPLSPRQAPPVSLRLL